MMMAARLDTLVSGWAFRLQLPRALEMVLTVPAQFCGMPASSLTLGPLLLGSLATGSEGLACCAGLLALSLGMCWFALLLHRGVRGGTDLMVGSPTGVLVAPFVAVNFLQHPQLWGGTTADGATAFSAGVFYGVCYFASQLLTASIKWAVLRRRPVHPERARELGLCNVRRHVQLAAECKYVSEGLGTYESFPSGDTAQGVQAATLMWMVARDTNAPPRTTTRAICGSKPDAATTLA